MSLLQALGLPAPGAGAPALFELHAGATFHRLAMISDVVSAYARDVLLDELPYMKSLDVGDARAEAKHHYREALRFDPGLAEAWFNLARLLQDAGDRPGALLAFNQAASLPPHRNAQAHAALHANAHWHAATILEDQGNDTAALARYRQAVALCDSFGVHHVRFAHLLRRTGHVEEAIAQYERLMTYSHRYFTEFVLPPLDPHAPVSAPAAALEVLYETSKGAPVVFWNNEYVRLPKAQRMPVTPEALVQALALPDRRDFLGRLKRIWQGLGSVARAPSISSLEA